MASKIPPQLSALLSAGSPEARDHAWEELVERFSRILLMGARNGAASYDETMDRYAYVLDRIRADDFRKLRTFSPDGAGEFGTWLFVVARRLAVDHHRKVFGRATVPEAVDSPGSHHSTARSRLARLLAEEIDPGLTPDPSAENPETAAWLRERNAALEEALNSLDPSDRLLLTLRFVDDIPVRKIATIMPFRSPFQVYRRLKKVLEILRSELTGRGISGL